MRQAAFLTLLFLGLFAVLAGVLWTRSHWRADVGPYREAMWLRVVLHPERFATGPGVAIVRTLNRVGLALLLVAVGIVLAEIVRITALSHH